MTRQLPMNQVTSRARLGSPAVSTANGLRKRRVPEAAMEARRRGATTRHWSACEEVMGGKGEKGEERR